MRQLTVTIPDDFYNTFIAFFKHIPEVKINEENNEFTERQDKMVAERLNNAKPEDYVDALESLENLKKKYGF
ncbi:MAG: hypothetical protein EOO46_24575 [Flavobacterium sp.]|nr:MAG: hypothetical protein EOO46_24575 [Flavobacterium sp.]